MRRGLLPILPALALAASAVLGLAAPTPAAFPGRNGRIAVSYFEGDPERIGPFRAGIGLLRADRSPSQTRANVIGCAPSPPRSRASCDYSSTALSPDGRWIAFDTGDEFSRERRIGVVRVDGTGRRLLPAAGKDPGNPTWSPKGGRIAFDSLRTAGSVRDLYVVAANGRGRPRRVVASASNPSWSARGLFAFERRALPAGSRIFVSRTSGAHAHAVSRRTGGTPTELSRDPDFSPGGSRLVYTSWNLHRLVVVGADGRGTRPLAATNAQYPAWSPDGRLLAWYRYGANPGIYVGRADGTHAHAIARNREGIGRTDGPGSSPGLSSLSYSPSWQPLRPRAAALPPRAGRG